MIGITSASSIVTEASSSVICRVLFVHVDFAIVFSPVSVHSTTPSSSARKATSTRSVHSSIVTFGGVPVTSTRLLPSQYFRIPSSLSAGFDHVHTILRSNSKVSGAHTVLSILKYDQFISSSIPSVASGSTSTTVAFGVKFVITVLCNNAQFSSYSAILTDPVLLSDHLIWISPLLTCTRSHASAHVFHPSTER